MKKYFLYTNGCYLGKVDTGRIELLLNKNGWSRSNTLQGSDIIIFNTCAYSQGKEDDCISTIKKFKKEKGKKTKLIVGGCLPIINKKRMQDAFSGPYFTPNTIQRLSETINAKYSDIDKIPLAQEILTDGNTYNGRVEKAFCIRIGYGCLGRCSFCAVKAVFPKLISRSKEDIESEFKLGLKNGHRNFLLSSEDSSVYGLDIKTDITELLRGLVKIKGEFGISLYRLNPYGLLKISDSFIEVLRSKKIVFLSIPINSGSDRIIRLMNRRYKIKKVSDYIERLKKMFPFLKINLDIMVGFPGETEQDFKGTLKVILETSPDSIRVFKYTDRSNSTARYLGKEIPSNIMNKRSGLLYQICEFAKSKYYKKQTPLNN